MQGDSPVVSPPAPSHADAPHARRYPSPPNEQQHIATPTEQLMDKGKSTYSYPSHVHPASKSASMSSAAPSSSSAALPQLPRHLHEEETRQGGESPTEVSLGGLRRMSITADSWNVQQQQQQQLPTLAMDWKAVEAKHLSSQSSAAPAPSSAAFYIHPSSSNVSSHAASPLQHGLVASMPPRSPPYPKSAAMSAADLLQLQTHSFLERSCSAPAVDLEPVVRPHASYSHMHAPQPMGKHTVADLPSATFLQPLHSFRPTLSRGGSLDQYHSNGISECTSVASSTVTSSRNSPRNGAVSASSMRDSSFVTSASVSASGTNSASGYIAIKHTVSAPVSSTVSKSNSQTHLAGLPGATSHDASPCMRGIQESELESQCSPCVVQAHFDDARVLVAEPGSTDSATRTIAPGSVDSHGSMGSAGSHGLLNGAGDNALQGRSPLQSEMVSPSTSHTSTSSLSARERNAKYKRSRATLEEAETSSNTQLKTSSHSSASTANGEALQASAAAAAAATEVVQLNQVPAAFARSTSAPPPQSNGNTITGSASVRPSTTATAAVPTATATATATSSTTTTTAPTPAPSTSLAPNTPKRQALISVLSCVLTQLFSNPNDRLPSDPRLLTRFHTERLPSISVGKYLERIAHYSECSDEALVMAFIHISRISHNKPSFNLNALSIHRLLLTSIMCTVKYFDDAYYNNNFYSKIGGVALKEINHLEIDFLELIQFELYIDTKVFVRFYEELSNSVLHPYCTCAYQRMVPLNLEEIENPAQI